MTRLPSPVMLLALLEGAELGVLRVGCVSSMFHLHLKNSPSVEL